ncbi:MAG: hypothetical protein ND866_28920 [Pyrinomonadaceae bacterium]|nr:hypothetical protein [Pyrinomonadaceae bacterium]
MRHHHLNVFSFWGRFILGIGFSGLLFFWAFFYLNSQAQSTCTTYYQCALLEPVSPNKVQGPIIYWFDNEQIEGVSFLTANEADDFRSRLRAAAADWAFKTGVSITEGSSGTVRIRVSGASFYTSLNGVVDPDQSNPGGKVMTFSTEWREWNAAGKDRIAFARVGTYSRHP